MSAGRWEARGGWDVAPCHCVCLPLTWQWAEPPAGAGTSLLGSARVSLRWHLAQSVLCGDTARLSSPLFPSFQLTVEMFDYLECELNLFQTGKPLIVVLCRVWCARCVVGSRKELSEFICLPCTSPELFLAKVIPCQSCLPAALLQCWGTCGDGSTA